MLRICAIDRSTSFCRIWKRHVDTRVICRGTCVVFVRGATRERMCILCVEFTRACAIHSSTGGCTQTRSSPCAFWDIHLSRSRLCTRRSRSGIRFARRNRVWAWDILRLLLLLVKNAIRLGSRCLTRVDLSDSGRDRARARRQRRLDQHASRFGVRRHALRFETTSGCLVHMPWCSVPLELLRMGDACGLAALTQTCKTDRRN